VGELNPAAAVGFDREAASYASVRPSYAAAALDLLDDCIGLAGGAEVCDLAAGTGILTRQLLAAGAHVTAVEPVVGMRHEFESSTPGAVIVDARAESLPFGDATFDAVTVAQAFHWFEAGPALAEIRRVLVPGGVLALLWNVRDESVDWVARWTDIVHSMTGGRPYHDHRELDWAEVIAGAGGFGPVERASFPNPRAATHAAVVERTRSTSFVAALDDDRQREVLAAVEEMTATHPELVGRDTFPFPYDTVVYWCRRVD